MLLLKNKNVHYIAIEGLDFTGKDTHTVALSDSLRAAGYNTIVATVYDNQWGVDVFNAVKNSEMSGESELAMIFGMWYSNILQIHRDIASGNRVNLSTHRRCYGTVVIFNRFIDSTYVYQCDMRGGKSSTYELYHREILNGFEADYTIVLTALPETMLKRTKSRSLIEAIDAKEKMVLANQMKMQKAYEARLSARNHEFISTEASIEEVKDRIAEVVMGYISRTKE